jgi:hypothetical protein
MTVSMGRTTPLRPTAASFWATGEAETTAASIAVEARRIWLRESMVSVCAG